MTLFGYARMKPVAPAARALLYAAAAFNFAAVPLLGLLARLAPAQLGLEPLRGGQMLYVDLFALLVAGFGVGYALAGRDLARHWPYVALGAVCKAGVAALVLAYFVAGLAAPLVMLLACGDAAFAVLFVRVLQQHGVTDDVRREP